MNLLNALLTGLALAPASFWMPPRGSTLAHEVDAIFYFIFWVALFFFVLIVGLMTVFIVRYRRRAGEGPEASPSHNTGLEITWTAIPILIVIAMFYLGVRAYLRMTVPPADAYEILVTAQQWSWQFTYPNGHVDKDLHVPAGQPVRLVMRSEDVIHSFYVPDFRVKQDVVPGRYTKVWFTAPAPGTHTLFCAEYCGTQHSDMIAAVVVHPPAEFAAWLEEAGGFLDKLPPAEAGQRLFVGRGCAQCHTVDGGASVGPTLKGVFGKRHALAEGGQALADEDYLRESLLDPQAKVVAGFQPVMPTYQGRLTDKEITVIIEYIKSLAGPGAQPGQGTP